MTERPIDAPSLEAFITAQLQARYRRRFREMERKLFERMPYGIMPSSVVIAGAPLHPAPHQPCAGPLQGTQIKAVILDEVGNRKARRKRAKQRR